MYSQERINAYLNSLERPQNPALEKIRQQALAEGVPIIRPAVQSLLQFFMKLSRPESILEVGTAVGYSALCMREACGESCHIVTIEKDAERIAKARENFAAFGAQDQIRLLEGDAADRLRELPDGVFSFIFMDAAKGQYLAFLPEVCRVLVPGGMIFSDNVMQEGEVMDSRFAVPRRDRTIHSRMRRYLYVLKHTEGLTTSVLPLGDGVAVTVKEGESVRLMSAESPEKEAGSAAARDDGRESAPGADSCGIHSGAVTAGNAAIQKDTAGGENDGE